MTVITTSNQGPPAGTTRPIVTTGLTQVTTPHGLTIFTNQPAGSVITYTVTTSEGITVSGSATVG